MPGQITIAIFAHNEARHIAACLASLPLDRPDIRAHLLVNGSSDGTAHIGQAIAARYHGLRVHDLAAPGKARTWNHIVHDLLTDPLPDLIAFMDGDARIAPGSFDAMAHEFAEHPQLNAVAGLPLNGRRHRHYQAMLREEGGLFGDLYALRGDFVARIRQRGLRLPVDLIGDDGLVCAWAATDLGRDAQWARARLGHAEAAGFRCEPVSLIRPASWRMQARRLTAYAIRHFQNSIVTDIMQRDGPDGLPEQLASLYPDWLPRFSPRPGLAGWFDRIALKRMARAAQDAHQISPTTSR